ncbi:MAG: TFIIB-type zinc ribbon-containing protein [Candidatus Bathyarchaeota archaeon]
MVQYCPECGGEMFYDVKTKLYSCKVCGLTLNYHEIEELRKRNIAKSSVDEEKKREKSEYLKWWLSKKK